MEKPEQSEAPTGTTTAMETTAEIARLAALKPVEYDREREGAADRLGVRLSTLDSEVEAKRPKSKTSPNPSRDGVNGILETVQPWHCSVDGAVVLAGIRDAFRRFVVLPDGAAEQQPYG
jgi:hypothetical protein